MRDSLRQFRSPARPLRALLLLLVLASCAAPRGEPAITPPQQPQPAASPSTIPEAAARAIAAVQAEYAPDRRVARVDVEGRSEDGVVVLAGETTDPAARAALLAVLDGSGVAYRDEITVLPDPALGDAVWALANNSVSNLRTTPGHSAELATQALLGTPLRVLKRQGGFYLVQTPDRYLAWVDSDGIHRMANADVAAHAVAPRLVYLRAAGTARAEPRDDAEPVADLVLGSLIEVVTPAAEGERFHRVRMPDGRPAWVGRDETAFWDEWVRLLNATEAGLVRTARTLMGSPYLWGGTSAKGMDCSGFTKTVYFMNGIILPRDASQQVNAGAMVDDRGEFGHLRPGDLLFFGRPASGADPERVVHVGMWIGDGRFIHSSGRVRVNSMDPAAPDYDEYNRNRYLRTKRVLGSGTGVKLLKDGGLYTF
ncbi:MAG TPA: C40 family peptidase [Longimicrobiales bacterium]|nr:C40 family peptidase [Longimicrobiales bacterium]